MIVGHEGPNFTQKGEERMTDKMGSGKSQEEILWLPRMYLLPLLRTNKTWSIIFYWKEMLGSTDVLPLKTDAIGKGEA